MPDLTQFTHEQKKLLRTLLAAKILQAHEAESAELSIAPFLVAQANIAAPLLRHPLLNEEGQR